jgi:hypothetical protein
MVSEEARMNPLLQLIVEQFRNMSAELKSDIHRDQKSMKTTLRED